MFTKIVGRIGRRSSHFDFENNARRLHHTADEREVVDTAPDLLHRCVLDTPFPSVAFGGYIKYYGARAAATDFADPDPLFDLSVTPQSLSRDIPHRPLSLSIKSSECPTMQEPETPRNKRFSLSGSSPISEKSHQLFSWKRAASIISSNIAEHQLSPIFSRSSTTSDRPSFNGMARSQSSSDSSPPDSIAFGSQDTSSDSDHSTLPPNTPTSLYYVGNDDADDLMQIVESHFTKCKDLGTRTRLQCHSVSPSSSSYGTAKTSFSQG